MDGTSDLQPLQPPRGSRDLGHNPPSYDDTIKPSSSSPKPLPFETHLSSTNKAIWSLYVDTAIAEDPHQLYDLICEQAKLPPVCRLRITGRRWPGRTSEDDFDFKLNLTSTLIGMSSYRDEWNELEVVRDGDGVAAYRGGWSTSLKWEHGFNLGSYPAEKSLEHQVEDLEEGRSLQGMKNDGLNEDESSLWTWCQRFCRDPTRIKSFTFQRKLTGFDYQALRSEVNWYLKSMNYEGQTSVNYDVSRLSVKFVIPPSLALLAYLKGRYKVVRSLWSTSRPIKDDEAPFGFGKIYPHGRSEAQIVDLLSPAIIEAIKDREHSGRVHATAYLNRLEARTQERMAHVGPFLPKENASGSSNAA